MSECIVYQISHEIKQLSSIALAPHSSCFFSFLNNKLRITLYKTENGKMQPLFFYYVYAALWRFDMHDILLDCQLLLLWFWSHQQLQLITILHEITRYEKFRNATAFFSISLSTFFFIDDYTKFVQQMTPGRFMTRKNAIKTFYVQLRVVFSIPNYL